MLVSEVSQFLRRRHGNSCANMYICMYLYLELPLSVLCIYTSVPVCLSISISMSMSMPMSRCMTHMSVYV